MNVLNTDTDDKKQVDNDLQARLITEDALASAQSVEMDVEQQPLANENVQVVHDQVTTRGERQPDLYRDSLFAVAWLSHLVIILGLAFVWGFPAMTSKSKSSYDDDHSYHPTDDDSGYNTTISVGGILGLLLLTTVASIGILMATLRFMIRHTSQLIQFSLGVSVVLSLVLGIVFLASGLVFCAILYLLLAALSCCYACRVWRRIPFATANLTTATTAIQRNMGIVGVAFGLVGALFLWSLLWVISLYGIYTKTTHCDYYNCEKTPVGNVVGVFYVLSFYWTSEVLKNVLVVTVSGVVGTWWFAPTEAASYWSPAVTDSLKRATSFSLGSICFGSLLMAIIQVLHHLVHEARRRGRGNDLLLCILECLVRCLESIADYFNKFAFIYIGLYGYDYLTAGKKTLQLFQERGWTTLINDNLIYRALAFMTLIVGGLTGLVGVILAHLIPSLVYNSMGDSGYSVAFFVPFVIGAGTSHIVFGVLASAADTVIVCFAESPNEFQANHPELSVRMLDAWRQIHPEFGL